MAVVDDHTHGVLRERIVDAMVQVVCERGYSRTTVTRVCAAARVSRATFNTIFDGVEECFIAVLDDGMERAVDIIAREFVREAYWVDGIRKALAQLLLFFDSEPALTRVLMLEATAATPRAREHREQLLANLTTMIERHWGLPEDGRPHPLDTAGVMASLLGVIHTELVTAPERPLLGLLGSLMGLATASYLSPVAVAREVERGERHARALLDERSRQDRAPTRAGCATPAILSDPRAHRARACVRYLAEHPGASNGQIAAATGIARHNQMSTLLARLHHAGLLTKAPGAPGYPNAWTLTSAGAQIVHRLPRGAASPESTRSSQWRDMPPNAWTSHT